METMMRWLTSGLGRTLGLAALLAIPAAAAAQEEAPPVVNGVPWRLVLEQQLRQEKTCDLNEVLMFDELKREGETVLEGKISCIDGRQFDFKRLHEHQKFELDLCQPAVC